MNTQTTEFKRKGRIGLNPLNIPDKGTVFVEVKSAKVETFTSHKYEDGIPFVLVDDLQTGETEKHLWLAGALKYQLESLQKTRGQLTGLKLEITHEGQKKVEIDGDMVNVNQYSLFELQ